MKTEIRKQSLDALKKHDAPAAFFIVGTFLRDNPDIVKRMVKEGHTVGNHTWHHPDMSAISTEGAFREELESVESLFKETTGQKNEPVLSTSAGGNSVPQIYRWQKSWDTLPFSGVSPT